MTCKRITQVTPIPLSRDSRTAKTAQSLSRLGYASIVDDRDKADGWLPRGVLRHAKRKHVGFHRAWHTWLQHRDQSKEWAHDVARQQYGEGALWLHSPYAARPIRHKRRPFVYDAHDLYQELDPRKQTSKVENVAAQNATRCITVSKGLAGILENRFDRSFDVIANFHDPRFDAKTSTGRVRTGLDATTPLLAMVATYASYRDFTALLKALKIERRLHLMWVGRSNGFEVPPSLRSRVHLLGPMRPNEIVPTIRDSNALFLPVVPKGQNGRYAAPNSFFQGTSAQLPILHHPGLVEVSEYTESYGHGLGIEITSEPQVHEALQSIAEGNLPIREGALSRASKALRWETQERRLQAIAETLCVG